MNRGEIILPDLVISDDVRDLICSENGWDGLNPPTKEDFVALFLRNLVAARIQSDRNRVGMVAWQDDVNANIAAALASITGAYERTP